MANTDQLVASARRVCQRAKHIEDRPNADLSPGWTDKTKPWMKRGSIHEADTNLIDATRDIRRRQLDRHPQSFQQIRRAAFRGDGAVAVLGHAHARSGDDERRRRRDVERSRGISASTTGIDQRRRVEVDFDPQRVFPHRRGKPGDLVDRLAAHAEPGDERPHLSGCHFARHDPVHDGCCLAGV